MKDNEKINIKVYCIDCKWVVDTATLGWNHRTYICNHLSNKIKKSTWLKESEERIDIPENLNKYNDCKNYEKNI